MKMLNIWLNKIENFFSLIAGATLFFMMLFISTDVFLRFFFNSPIQGTLEITGEYLMVIVVYFGVGYTLKEDGHVSVDFLKGYIPEVLKKPIKIITNLLAIIILVIIGHSNLLKSVEYFEKNMVSLSLLKYPLAPALIIISLGLFIMAVRLLVNTIDIVIHQLKPRDNTGV